MARTSTVSTERSGAPDRRRSAHRGRRVRVGAIVAVAALAALSIWLGLDLTKDDETPSSGSPSRTIGLSERGLTTIAGALGHPLYWVGARERTTYELTTTSDGRFYVRYLPTGERVGTTKPFLTVGTYPVPYAATVRASRGSRSGSVRLASGSGRVAFYTKTRPTNVYAGVAGSSYQIEVYDPSPGVAQNLVTTGQTRAIEAGTSPTSTARPATVTRKALAQLASTLGRPVYWAGPRSGVAYELTQTPDGRTYVRYLPHGVPAGSRRAALTVATYPVADAFARTAARAKLPGSVRVAAPGGATAFYSTAHPTSVYVAYPGNGVQIEVFAPAPGQARRFVSSGKIVPVS